MAAQQKITKFRAYQLGEAGSSFSYFDGTHFTLIEARLTDTNEPSIKLELNECGLTKISTLHITSWDRDHCVPSQLEKIIDRFNPDKIEYPGYEPHTDTGRASLDIIKRFKIRKTATQITPIYIKSLDKATDFGYKDVLYHPKVINDDPSKANDNSTVKFFRAGSFNVLSLGDLESPMISSGLITYGGITNEIDVMILAHHGADNGFTTSKFLRSTKPKVAIATSNYDNQFDHPRQNIRDLLHKNDVRLFTTKTGDVVIRSVEPHTGEFRVYNLIGGNTKLSSHYDCVSKKKLKLSVNSDTLRARIKKRSPKLK